MKRSNSMEICAILSNYHYRFYLIMVWLFLFPNLISSQDIAADSANNAKIKVSYLPNKGFQLSTLDNNYSLDELMNIKRYKIILLLNWKNRIVRSSTLTWRRIQLTWKVRWTELPP